MGSLINAVNADAMPRLLDICARWSTVSTTCVRSTTSLNLVRTAFQYSLVPDCSSGCAAATSNFTASQMPAQAALSALPAIAMLASSMRVRTDSSPSTMFMALWPTCVS